MKFIACGDVALCKGIEDMILNGEGNKIAASFRDRIKDADIFLADIECPLTDSVIPGFDFPTLKASCECGALLEQLGVTVGTLANNHIADYGLKGFQDTVSTLEKCGIMWCGAGRDPREACKPLIFQKDGVKIGILALAQPENSAAKNGRWGAGVLEEKSAVMAMKELAQLVDVAIASLHFGVEFSSYPTPDQIKLGHQLIDAGALVILGHHPHVPQGFEYYNGGFIAYSLGNFIFDMIPGDNKFSNMGLLVEFEVNDQKKLEYVEVVPVKVKDGNPTAYTGRDFVEAQAYLEILCEPIIHPEFLKKQYYFTCRNNLEMHINAFMSFLVKKRNLKRVCTAINIQFRPQILRIRTDLARFLLSGEACSYETGERSSNKDIKRKLWLGICTIAEKIGKLIRIGVNA